MFEIQIDGTTAVLRMVHGKVNVMNLEFLRDLNQQLDDLSSNDQVSHVVVSGNPKVFSAGVDLKRLVAEGPEYLDEFLPAISRMFMKVFTFEKPLIAAVTGHAVAGGCVLACAADFRVISTEAKIGVPELRVGVPFPSAGLEIMRWATVGPAFRRMINTGATFVGEEAVAVGLADEATNPAAVVETALEAIEPFRVVPPAVFRLTKQQMRQPVRDRIERSEELFGEDIKRLWHDENTRRAISDYVAERLTR